MFCIPRRILLRIFFGITGVVFLGVPGALAQAWWSSIQYGPPEIKDGFLPVPSIATSLPQNGDPAGYRKWLGERGVVAISGFVRAVSVSAGTPARFNRTRTVSWRAG